ncbi:MAG TPA: 4'-phosphopantetheinyl transferase superfamily protein [Candidatus Caenarcaniphilales bacterium]
MGVVSREPEWSPPTEPLVLESNQVHVWRASLELSSLRLKGLQRILSVDELQRAKQFVRQKDQDAFVAARGVLRLILSRYLKQGPESLYFCYGSHGKPALSFECNPDGLCFNLSHSGGLALYAVAMNQELGVDLEQVHTNLAYEAIAQRFFSPQESATLLALPPHDRVQAFFNGWTRKEAYVKAEGHGISLPLKQFDVSLAPGEVAAIVSIAGDFQAGTQWTLQALDPGLGYVAALAIKGRTWQVKCWHWEEAHNEIDTYS